LPRALYEAAVIDGCNEFSAFWRVLLPLARPGLVTVAIFQFIGQPTPDPFAGFDPAAQPVPVVSHSVQSVSQRKS